MQLPSDDKFATMPYPLLYRWHKDAEMAQDIIGTKMALGEPIDPCLAALAYKGYTAIDQAMKYR
jgi:hypothetical protein